MLLTSKKYIARNDDILLHTLLWNFSTYKTIGPLVNLFTKQLLFPLDNNAICDVRRLHNPIEVPGTFQSSFILTENYNIQELAKNLWLIS